MKKYLHQVVDPEVVDVGHAAVYGLPDFDRPSGVAGKHRARQAVPEFCFDAARRRSFKESGNRHW